MKGLFNKNTYIIILLLLIAGLFFLFLFKSDFFPKNTPAIFPSIAPTSTINKKQNTENLIFACSQNSDCIFVTSGCPCNGPRAAVNKNYTEAWKNQYPTQKFCLQVVCMTPKTACVNNKCELKEK